MTITLVVVAAVLAVAGWVLVRYNALVRLRDRLDNAWNQLDLQLRRRHDEVADLMRSLPPDHRHAIASALDRARRPANDPRERAAAEADLVSALRRMAADAHLGSAAAGRLDAIEAQIAHACAHHDETVRRYSIRRGPGPSALVARALGAGPRHPFADADHRPLVLGPWPAIGDRRSA